MMPLERWRSTKGICVGGLVLLVGAVMQTSAAPGPRAVMTWIPPYSISACRARLETAEEGAEPASALTDVALQFWQPTREGNVALVAKYGQITDQTIDGIRDWAHAHGLRALLCVYNGADGWDWALARSAFGSHRSDFVRALIQEMERRKLDGIDVDLEGNGELNDARGDFVEFIRALSKELRGRRQRLTVDTFAYRWNAPNQTWWPDLWPLVDGVNSMGYEETGAAADGWRGYAAQKAAAGSDAGKLLIGIPGDKPAWQGKTAVENLEWIARDDAVGVAIWDASFSAGPWRQGEAWDILRKIKQSR